MAGKKTELLWREFNGGRIKITRRRRGLRVWRRILLRAEADDGEKATAHGCFFAVAEEVGDVAGGAEVGDGDVLFAEAGFEELELIRFL